MIFVSVIGSALAASAAILSENSAEGQGTPAQIIPSTTGGEKARQDKTAREKTAGVKCNSPTAGKPRVPSAVPGRQESPKTATSSPALANPVVNADADKSSPPTKPEAKGADAKAGDGKDGSPEPTGGQSRSISVTYHVQYMSSVGVLGCKINLDRVEYWPRAVSCNDMCIKVSHGGRELHLLHIDTSIAAYDISYDAWNYLVTGLSATNGPTSGGGVDVTWEPADMSQCLDLIHTKDKKLPLSAANSMNFVSGCSANKTWVGQNYQLYNIYDARCKFGIMDKCSVNLKEQNTPVCESSALASQEETGYEVVDTQ